MEIICRICSISKKTPYKDICRNCYQLEWLKKIPKKVCINCKKTFKSSGKTCFSCQSNRRNNASRSIQCTNCKRIGLIISNKKYLLCIKCERERKEKENPLLADKRRSYLMNYSRIKKGKDLRAPKRVSKGWWKTSSGYIMIYNPKHPNADINGCVKQHTFVMSKYLGRPLFKNENIHHINGQRDDNRIENLELWNKSQCSGQRLDEKIEWAISFLNIYGYKITKN